MAICVPPAAPQVAITIRRFGKRSYSPEDLVRFGSLPQEVLDAARTALLGRRNILVSGGTGSGKTTLLNALVELLPVDDRIVSIEDTLELRDRPEKLCPLRGSGDRRRIGDDPRPRQARASPPARSHCRRRSPGRRGRRSPAGAQYRARRIPDHDHANNTESALSRLATCAMQGETDLPWEVTCRGVVDGISMVIHMTRREGRRYVEEATTRRRLRRRKAALALQARCVRRPPVQTGAAAVMPDNAARMMRRGSAGIVRAILLRVRGYTAEKNLCLTAPIWPVKHDKDMEPCEDMNDKSKPALSLVTPQARHHYTRFDQVDLLVGASEEDADVGFMTRLLMLCSLPRTDPGNRHQYKRANGPYKLVMIVGLITVSHSESYPACCWPGCARKRYGPKAGSWSWVARFRLSCGGWASTAPAEAPLAGGRG